MPECLNDACTKECTTECRAVIQQAWDVLRRSSGLTAAPYDPEVVRQATERAEQAAAASERGAEWFASQQDTTEVEQLRAAIARVQKLVDTGPIGVCCAHLVRAALGHPQPPAKELYKPWTCAHGHAWGPYNPCAECLAAGEQPHVAEPEEARLFPHTTTRYLVCRRCTQAVGEPCHVAAPGLPHPPTTA